MGLNSFLGLMRMSAENVESARIVEFVENVAPNAFILAML